MSMTTKKGRRHSGDTIVEVLIAITVLSMALGTGFAIVSQSNKGLQANKEQFQAQQLANQQVEYLRASTAGMRNTFSSNPDCLVVSGAGFSTVTGASCQNLAMGGGAGIYTVDISCVISGVGKEPCPPTVAPGQTQTYSVVVTWDNVKNSQSRLELQYAM